MNNVYASIKRISKCVDSKKIVFVTALLLSGVVVAKPHTEKVPNVPPGAYNQGIDIPDQAQAPLPDGTPLQILWTNDTHGFFLPVYHAEYSEIDSYAETAATEGKVGGYAQVAGLVKVLRQGIWEQNTMLVDAGDTFDGSPVAQMTRGHAVVPVLNAMGYDAWTPGNRDFAWTKADFMSVTGELNFPMVCANLQDAATHQFVFPRYIIKQIGGLKVAILGLTSLAGGGQGFEVLGGPIPGTVLENSISALTADIRANENPDLVVAISHMGFYQDQKIAAHTTGIDVIVGSHTHHNVYTAPTVANADGSRNVIVVQAGSHGKFLGQLQLWVQDQQVTSYSNSLVRVTAQTLNDLHATPDSTVEELAEQAYEPFAEYLDEVVGQSTTVLERRGDTQSTMTNFLTDALAERYGVDGARFPGIRYGSSIIPGPITVGDVWNIVSPNFGDNKVYTFTQTGAQILGALNNGLNTEYGTDPYQWNGGDVFRFNGRVKYTFKVNAPNNQHVRSLSVTKANGQAVSLVTNGVPVTANLGTVFTFASTLPSGTPVPNVTAVDEIVSYIQNKGTVGPTIDDRTVQADSAPTNVTDIY
ncbi:MAG: 5'-nucleotidase C-terminal domain-containing protein [Gammaproteobacteria bacterium]|nr:5'-nucleotidase C-terminal domain-containing protein [Gammaproteobacteria bacterium]